jgi:hypothetical protein
LRALKIAGRCGRFAAKAITAVDRTAAIRTERHFAGLSALSTGRLVHLTLRTSAAERRPTAKTATHPFIATEPVIAFEVVHPVRSYDVYYIVTLSKLYRIS